jgi:hypothetical protein
MPAMPNTRIRQGTSSSVASTMPMTAQKAVSMTIRGLVSSMY